ncbi:MAG: hypothetical protein P4K93_11665 [Terracidiphilus sp.]|nr:hypothetical protein [Terracidiphilus sp.]
MNRTAMFVMRMAGLAVVAAAVAGSPAWAKNNRDAETSRATITLRVYDYAQVKPATLAAAEREASRILAQAGVTTQWQDCPTSHDASKDFRGCAAPQSDDYIVSILPNSMADKLGKGDTFGAADSGASHRAAIFYERISERAGGDTTAMDVLAGRVMAREIGSLLLGANTSSRTGIMKAQWTSNDLNVLAGNEMYFTAQQARQMDTRLVQEARMRQAETQTRVATNDR